MNPQEYAKELIDRLVQHEQAEMAAAQQREADRLNEIKARAYERLAYIFAEYPALAQFATVITQYSPEECKTFSLDLPGYWPIIFDIVKGNPNSNVRYFIDHFNVYVNGVTTAAPYVNSDMPLEFALAFALRAAWKGDQE